MSDEVRDMIRTALADEPALGLSFEQVVTDGRRRRARRRAGAFAGAAAGVTAVVAAAVVTGAVTGGRNGSEPAASVSSATPVQVTTSSAVPQAQGCAAGVMTGGFPDLPDGEASAEELAESARLTEAFGQVALPLPEGVTATPLRLCALDESWGGTFTLTGQRVVFVYVRARGGQPPGECVIHAPTARCSVRTLPDGSVARITAENGPTVLVSADVWRADGTYASVMETGGDNSTNRVLDDDGLVAIATAPQLRVHRPGPQRPAAPSDRRAAELDAVVAGALPAGLRVEPAPGAPADRAWRFRVAQGGYRAVATLADDTGRGWVMVNLGAPGEGSVTCGGQPGCELVTLSDGRAAAVTTRTEGGRTVVVLGTRAADGTQVEVHTSNSAEEGGAGGAPTRPAPPLAVADLVRIAELPDLHW
ncbi:hypothetical protein [Saccharothrix syringae]|uniref:Uncharacterized protein n=1 Tax=Saccharothrix syringae TaxID=103733 RepID=A0A5Q0GZB8_SACSY|nr:hypothetical protein [Saccharothrix syringae]QFZ19193.1 hypothetical protein EKG83_18640 [Saccharothrix syringae]